MTLTVEEIRRIEYNRKLYGCKDCHRYILLQCSGGVDGEILDGIPMSNLYEPVVTVVSEKPKATMWRPMTIITNYLSCARWYGRLK